MSTPHNTIDYLIFCSIGAAAPGFGEKVLKIMPPPEHVVSAAVLALVGALVGGGVKLFYDWLKIKLKL